MNTFKGFMLSTMLLATGIVAIGEASAQGRRRVDRNDDIFFDDYSSQVRVIELGQGKIRVVKDLYLEKRGQQIIPVKAQLKLGRFRGYSLKKVAMKASTARGMGMASLHINGMQEGFAQQVGTYDQKVAFQASNHRNVLGRNVNTIQIHTRGHFTVTKLIAVLQQERGGHGPGRGQSISTYVGQTFGRQTGNLMVGQQLRLGQHQGKQLMVVNVMAEDLSNGRGRGQGRGNGRGLGARAILLVDGMPVGMPQQVPAFGSMRFTMPINNTIGYDFQRVQIKFTGRVFVEEVSARIQNGVGRGGRRGGRF